MFSLRRFSGEGIESNNALGDSYIYIDREQNPERFRNTFKAHFEKDHVADLDDKSDDDTKNVYAFIYADLNGYLQPLYKKQRAYIVTDSGTTYSNVSYKG